MQKAALQMDLLVYERTARERKTRTGGRVEIWVRVKVMVWNILNSDTDLYGKHYCGVLG